LEGDCVGLSKANTSEPGSKETGFFLRVIAAHLAVVARLDRAIQ
jgi:hypothetical protein